MPEPTGLVAWEDLRVGETYWLFCRGHRLSDGWLPVKVTPDSIWDEGESSISIDAGMSEGRSWYWMDEISKTPDGKPMIYATCAQACDAMIERLQKFMAEQGEGNA